MVFNDTFGEALGFLILLAFGVLAGIIYNVTYTVRSISKSNVIRFIVDFFYAIIVGITFLIGIIIASKGRIEYYHIFAEAIGILIGAFPIRFIKKKVPALMEIHLRHMKKWKSSKVYRRLTK